MSSTASGELGRTDAGTASGRSAGTRAPTGRSGGSSLAGTATILAALLFGAAGAMAASPRVLSSVTGPTVRLSDLFTDLEPGQDCDIGPAPSPGQRITIGPAQLGAIADQFGVVLPSGATLGSVTLDRKGRRLLPEDVLPAVRTALQGAGLSADSEVELVSFVSPVVPMSATAPPVVDSLDFDGRAGRFSVMMLVQAPDAEPVRFRLIGRTRQMTDAVVLVRAEPAGVVLAQADLRMVRLPATAVHGQPIATISEAVGQSLQRPLGENQPIERDMLRRPLLIERGRSVVLRLADGGLALTVSGQSLEAGGAGDRIHVLNTSSRAILEGTIGADGQVRIDPGTTPVMAPAAAGAGGLPAIPSAGPGHWANRSQEASLR
ncbi:flagellar basal body P-ring formation chaperone FlgA [Rhizosaccharibacter radicis]|uniref:Flagellar basal body P-ring formation chaperone FlgA n=1 Tax=Rhizosaccharibacter radicis TaxID=2782605 RepID=A0ABT1W1S7_9PROT|nr:flagellar basal body P-ring formation chaperone FlgA [Acetobacteraceae bacterium KSS12]